MRQHLRVLLLQPGFPSPKEFHIPLLPLSLSHHVETNSSPPKHTDWMYHLGSSVPYYNTLRWRCWALPPGPQCLCYKGITTISLLYDTSIYVSTYWFMVGRVGFEPTMSFQRRIMSPLHSATVRPARYKQYNIRAYSCQEIVGDCRKG